MTDNLVGIENQVEEIMKLLDVEATDIRIVGLYGMGGIGKTTIAKFIYNILFHDFQACSFLADVKESSHTQGLVCLQKQLIYDISKQSNTDFSRVDDGIKLIRERFRDKKVIIVIDDVGDKKEVDALGGGIEWFGAGSRVIITTRDKEVLNIPKRNIYEVKELDDGKSLKLFCRHAFKRDHPPSNRKGKLASDIVAITGGLPLALEVIGSLLYKKNLEKWRGTFDELKVSPHDDIKSKLKISYDGLNDRQQVLFLDIACLFIGHYKQSVFPMWNACKLFPGSNFSTLVNKCLVRIDDDDRIRMHDQLRDFGRDLVRKEHITQPGNRSRVWDMKDVFNVLKEYKDTCKAEAITCHNNVNENDYSFTRGPTQLELTNEEFANKSSLRYLEVQWAKFYGDFNGLFPGLIWLCFKHCHFHYTLTNFCPKKLVILELWSCDITEKWNGWKILEMAVNLKILAVNYCKKLRKSPKFTKNNGLERLSLKGCENMTKIDASIKSLQHLIFLDLSGCRSLEKLPDELSSLKKLKALYMAGSGIDFLPNAIEKLSELESLSIHPEPLSYVERLWGPEYLIRLERHWDPEYLFRLERHWSQDKLPEFLIQSSSYLKKLPKSFGFLRNISKLKLRCCNSLRKLPKSIGELRKLRELIIIDCPLKKLPSSITSLKSLTVLHVELTKIRKLPNSIGNLKNLEVLNISTNDFLQGLPDSVWNLEKLETLDARRCEVMKVSIPDDIGNLINLRIMNLERTTIQSTSTSICNLSSIQELNLSRVFFLGSLPDLPTNVQILTISYEAGISSVVNKLRNLKMLVYDDYYGFGTRVDIIAVPSGVQDLSILYWHKVESLPPLNSNLKSLKISSCESLESLGDLSNLTNLSRLKVSFCPRIREIRGLNKLASLRYLKVSRCSGLVTLDGLEHLALLQSLDIEGCVSIEQLPDLSHLALLHTLTIRGCKSIEQLPDLLHLKYLKKCMVRPKDSD